jgi:hypothetical protein
VNRRFSYGEIRDIGVQVWILRNSRTLAVVQADIDIECYWVCVLSRILLHLYRTARVHGASSRTVEEKTLVVVFGQINR